jgi:hypothetical protein
MDGSATLLLQAEIKKWWTDLLLLEFPGASSSVSRRPLGGGGAGGLVGLPPGDGRRPGRQLEGGPRPACWEYLIARRRGVLGRRPSGTSEAPGKADGQRGRGGRPELLGRPAAGVHGKAGRARPRQRRSTRGAASRAQDASTRQSSRELRSRCCRARVASACSSFASSSASPALAALPDG